MKINRYIPHLLVGTLLCSSFLVACNKEKNELLTTSEETVVEGTTEPVTEIMTETIESGTTESETSQTQTDDNANLKSITITVLNMSEINIGMFSVIDPVTNEQINLDSLESGTSVSMECNWPKDINEFHWALYNEAGELCVDASTDISAVNKAVALMLSGEDTIDNVEVISE